MARAASSDPLEKFRFRVYSLTASEDNQEEGKILDSNNNEITVSISQADAIGFSTVQLPKLTTNKISYREGDNFINVSSLSPGLSSTEDITFSKGVAKNDSTNFSWFYQWASSVHIGTDTTSDFNYIDGNKSATENALSRRHLRIVMLDRTGKWAKVWDVYNAFPVQFTPGSDLDASADDGKSIESLTIAYESFKEQKVNAAGTGVA